MQLVHGNCYCVRSMHVSAHHVSRTRRLHTARTLVRVCCHIMRTDQASSPAFIYPARHTTRTHSLHPDSSPRSIYANFKIDTCVVPKGHMRLSHTCVQPPTDLQTCVKLLHTEPVCRFALGITYRRHGINRPAHIHVTGVQNLNNWSAWTCKLVVKVCRSARNVAQQTLVFV